jgi:hypothetical protein
LRWRRYRLNPDSKIRMNMLEQLANIGELLGGVAVLASLVYVGIQLRETRKQMQANALQLSIDSRIAIWSRQLDSEALHCAKDKFFDDELYKRDEELTLRERRAESSALLIELVFAQSQFFQKKQQIIDEEQYKPLDYMSFLIPAPHRREWKDRLRLNGYFPNDYIAHVDEVVKKYDEVEKIMDANEDADFFSTVSQIFNTPAPPNWIET